MRLISAKVAQHRCDRFNERCPAGTRVTIRLDSGDPFASTTAADARVTPSRSVVVLVHGMNGWLPIDRVVPLRLEAST